MMDLKEIWAVWLALGDVLPIDARLKIAHAACYEIDGSKIEVLHTSDARCVLQTEGEAATVLRAWLGRYGVLYSNQAKHSVLSRALRCAQVLTDIIDPELPVAEIA